MKYSKSEGCKRPWLLSCWFFFSGWHSSWATGGPGLWVNIGSPDECVGLTVALWRHKAPGGQAPMGHPGLSWMLDAAKEVLSPGMLDCSQRRSACCMRWEGPWVWRRYVLGAQVQWVWPQRGPQRWAGRVEAGVWTGPAQAAGVGLRLHRHCYHCGECVLFWGNATTKPVGSPLGQFRLGRVKNKSTSTTGFDVTVSGMAVQWLSLLYFLNWYETHTIISDKKSILVFFHMQILYRRSPIYKISVKTTISL